jgi:hypothetical protein
LAVGDFGATISKIKPKYYNKEVGRIERALANWRV